MTTSHSSKPDSAGTRGNAVVRAIPLALVLVLGACANPAPTDQAGNEQECVYVRVTGSNLPVKECRTQAEREAIAAQNREAADQGFRNQQQLDEFGVASPGAESLP